MPAYGVSIKLDTATPGVERIRSALASREFAPAVGEALKLAAMNHFQAKEAAPATHKTANRLGAKPIGVYSEFARATSWKATASGVLITVTHPAIRQRIQGGEIKPTGDKEYLTIPAIGAAYGKRVRDFGYELEMGIFTDGWGRTGLGWGLRDDFKVQKITRRKGELKVTQKTKYRAGVYFWAVRSVNQGPDNTVIPSDEQFFIGVEKAIGGWLQEQKNGG